IRTQFHHMIDIVPTILEATGLPAPSIVNGVGQKPIEGVSMTYTWDKERQRPVQARYPVFRDARQSWHLPRWLDGKHETSGPALGRRRCEDAQRAHGVYVGAIQHCQGLFAGRRSCDKDAGQAARDAELVFSGSIKIQRVPT